MIFKNIEDDPYHEILPFKTGFSHLYFILAIVLIHQKNLKYFLKMFRQTIIKFNSSIT